MDKQETKDGGDSVVINSSKQQAERFVTYEECRKNHAASIGKYAVDGCCEFMPSVGGKSGCAEAAMWCAACSCHRNFHKKVVRRRHQETTEYSKLCERCCNNLSAAYEYKPPSTPK